MIFFFLIRNKYIQCPWWVEEVDGGWSFSDLRSLASVSDEESVSWACCCLVHMSAYRPPFRSSSSCLRWKDGRSLVNSSDKIGIHYTAGKTQFRTTDNEKKLTVLALRCGPHG